MLHNIIEKLLEELVGAGELRLAPEASIDTLVSALVVSAAKTPIGSQFGPWLGKALMDSELVEELYADDVTLNQYLKDLRI